ncbi:MAG: hypothetical protein WDZ35_00765 [Crocinitomicaceae bacterium]
MADVTREYVDGRIHKIYDADTGEVTEGNTQHDPSHEGEPFEQKGAQLEFQEGHQVTYLRITLPNGKKIVKEIGSK